MYCILSSNLVSTLSVKQLASSKVETLAIPVDQRIFVQRVGIFL